MAFFDNIKFPFFTMQELNLDWLLNEVKRIAGFMPQGGSIGDILTRKSDGAAWEPPAAVQVDIAGLPEDTEILDNDQLIFYDISAQANRKIKPNNLMDSMCSNGTPYMNGTGSAGTSKKPSRYDHVHPTDTSRQAALSGVQMNAVNSGAPSGCFSGGKLKVENGGTDADNGADACANLGAAPAAQLDGVSFQNSTIQVGGSVTITLDGTAYGAGFVFAGSGIASERGILAFGSGVAAGSPVTATVEVAATDLSVTTSGRSFTITNNGSSACRICVFRISGTTITITTS